MAGHGWVIPNKDGSVARCGGPGMCGACMRELAALRNETRQGLTNARPVCHHPPSERVMIRFGHRKKHLDLRYCKLCGLDTGGTGHNPLSVDLEQELNSLQEFAEIEIARGLATVGPQQEASDHDEQ
jgi:hypothetical protein